jgi:NitT/TauT family transport system permease protein
VDQSLNRRAWGEAGAELGRVRRFGWSDLLFVFGVAALVVGICLLGQHWHAARVPEVPTELQPDRLSLWELPLLTFFSLMRGLIAYVLSLVFTLVYGYWAAKDLRAQRVLIPLLDILQSIPVLGFMPVLLLVFVKAFPDNNVGLELAAIISIFTGQAWNMTFSFYQSVRSVPQDMQEAATVYRFSWWRRFKWVEVPFSMMGLVWNSMMSMAGGWFFLAMIEGLEIGHHKYWSPGIGSFIKAATDAANWPLVFAGVVAMVVMIVALDQLLWRPVVAWAKKFRVEEGGATEEAKSWFLDWMLRSRLLAAVGEWVGGLRRRVDVAAPAKAPAAPVDPTRPRPWANVLSVALFVVLIGVLAWGAVALAMLMWAVPAGKWLDLGLYALWTLLRVLACVVIATLWTLPAGLAIGLSPRLSRFFQPIVQVTASFPAPLLFPLVMLALVAIHLNWGSVLLMLLGTQWYILFNVIAGAMAIPADLKEAATSYRITGWQRFRVLYFPAVFPFLVTGWVTAAGGAWNASIVAEYVESGPQIKTAEGLGAQIMLAAGGDDHRPGESFDKPPEGGPADPAADAKPEADPSDQTAAPPDAEEPDNANYPLLAASVLVMSTVVVLFNRFVWKRLYEMADRRFSIQR